MRLARGRSEHREALGEVAVYFLGTPTQGTPGSDYRLCWSSSGTLKTNYLVELHSNAELWGSEPTQCAARGRRNTHGA